jgi:hypothetical protein
MNLFSGVHSFTRLDRSQDLFNDYRQTSRLCEKYWLTQGKPIAIRKQALPDVGPTSVLRIWIRSHRRTRGARSFFDLIAPQPLVQEL